MCERNIFTGRSSNSEGKERKEKKTTEAAALRHSCLSWKKKWDLKKFLRRYPAEPSRSGLLRVSAFSWICALDLCSTMVLTQDGWEDKALQGLFLHLIKLSYSPHLRAHSPACVHSPLRTGEPLFILLSAGGAQQQLRG